MSIEIADFEWDKHNVGHLKQAHPSADLCLLEDIVRHAKTYEYIGRDRFGRKVYGVRSGRLTVLFNIKPGRRIRIFSVREG